MNNFTFNYKIIYLSGTTTGGSLEIEAMNKVFAQKVAMDVIINQLRRDGKSENLKEIIIL